MFESDSEILILHLENRKSVFYTPLKRGERIKYTAFAVSKNYIIFGATSGGLYIFKKDPCSFWQLIPSKETAVTSIAISSSENFVAFSTNKGIVCIVELNENSNGKLITRTQDLSNYEITALCWIEDNAKLILLIGDNSGRVSSLKLSFLNKNVVHVPTSVLVTLDSKVVQLCYEEEFLLVSTISRCYICDITKEQYKQIGQRLRDGYYGATFLKQRKKIFCTRPGNRLWEVDFDGVVHSTHQFKHKLETKSLSSFVTIFEEKKIFDQVIKEKHSHDSAVSNFTKIYDFCGQYVVTFSSDTICILNIDTVEVTFSNNCFGRIKDVQRFENMIYIWNDEGDLHELVFLSLERCLLTLYFKKHYHLCVELIYRYFEKIISSRSSLLLLLPLRNMQWKTYLETNIVDSDFNSDKDDFETNKIRILSAFEEQLKCLSTVNDFVKLNSGIHMVNNKFLWSTFEKSVNDSIDNNFKRSVEQKICDATTYDTNSYRCEPVIDSNKFGKTIQENDQTSVHVDFSKILALLQCYDENVVKVKNDCTDGDESMCVYKNNAQYVFDIMNAVLEEYDNISRKYNFESCQCFPFNKNEKCAEQLNTIFNAYFNRKFILEWFQQAEHFFTSSKSELKFTEMYPNLLIEIFDEHELKLDYFLNKTLIIFSPLMNALTIFEAIKSFHLPCYYLTFCFILKYFQLGESFEYNNYENNGDGSGFKNADEKIIFWPMPVYLNTMLLMINVDQVDVFCEMGLKKVIDICDVTYMILYLEQTEMRNNQNDNNECDNLRKKIKIVWLTYLQKRCQQKSNSEADIYCDDPNVLRLVVKMFLSLYSGHKNNESCCKCWFLLPSVLSPPPLSSFSSLSYTSANIEEKFISVGCTLLSQFWHIFQNYAYNIDSIEANNEGSRNSYYNDTKNTDYNSVSKKNVFNSPEILLQIRRSINDTTEYRVPLTYTCYKNLDSCKHLICEKVKTHRQVANLSDKSLWLSLNIICSFCHHIPHLWKYIPTLQKNMDIKLLHAQHFIQLGDIVELESLYRHMTSTDAHLILNWKSLISNGNCLNCCSKIMTLNCESGISWNDLILLILQHLEVKKTLELLDEFSAVATLNKSFYRSTVLVSLRGINVNCMHHVTSAVSNHDAMTLIATNILKKLQISLKQDKSKKELKLKNSNMCHWGLTVYVEESNQAICYCCSLPLFSKSLIKEHNGGVFLFSCNHTYHTVCLKHRDCTAICLVCDRFLR